MKTILCITCEDSFDPHGKEKKMSGGRYNQCPECSEEHIVRSVGLTAGDGKMASVTILHFQSNSDREKYLQFWQNNTGLHKGKNCQLGSHLSTTPNVKFRIQQAPEATNHKGKL